MNDWLAMEYDEILNEAIMSETPILVVEGIDDVSVYEGFTDSLEKEIEVIAVQNLKDMNEGSRGVIDFIKALYDIQYDGEIEKYILGIIDRDARFYRGELIHLPALLILKWYSMESHFATKEAVKCVMENCTRTRGKLISDDLVSGIYNRILNSLMDLYYISLESMKNACERNYNGAVSFSMSVPQMRGTDKFNEVLNKQYELDEFAKERNINKNFDGLLAICKGKWLVGEFSRLLIKEIKQLNNHCSSGVIQQCQFCHNGRYDLCLYGFSVSYNESQICNIIKNNEGYTQFSYMREAINMMV